MAFSTFTMADMVKPTSSASQREPVLLSGAQHLQLFPDILRNCLHLGLSASGAERKLDGHGGFQTSS